MWLNMQATYDLRKARRAAHLMKKLREIQSFWGRKAKEKGVKSEKDVEQLVRQGRIRKARGMVHWEGNLDLSRSDK